MAFSATDAAFEGFRLARRTPLTILIWAAAHILFSLLFFGLAGGSFATLMAAMNDIQGISNPTPQDLEPIWAAYAGFMWTVPFSIVLSVVLYTAAIRAIVRPEESRFGYMRLGMDEVRVFVVSLVLSILAAVLYFGVVIVAAIVGSVMGVVMQDVGPVMILLAFLLGFLVIGLFIWLAVRFSLALPITVAERKFAIFDSWNVTKGHALGLFLMTLIMIVMAIVVSILVWLVLLPLMFFSGGISALAGMEGADFSQIMSAMGPAIVIYVITNGIMSALCLAIFMAPYAAAYRDIRGGTSAVGISPAE